MESSFSMTPDTPFDRKNAEKEPSRVACAIVFNERQEILLVRPKEGEKWILPGGKIEEGEAPLDCLLREFEEEVPGLEEEVRNLCLFDSFEATTPNTRRLFKSETFIATIQEQERESLESSAEIAELTWTADPFEFDLSGGTRKMIEAVLL